jgi:hypothetical protein
MKIFLTYASEDKNTAERIYFALTGLHHTVFFDHASLPAGDDYNGRIREAILASDLMVFLVSDDSVAPSSYALTELALAQKKWPHPARAVLPVMVRVTDYERIPNYLKAVTILQPRGDLAADVAHEVANVADARRHPATIARALSKHLAGMVMVVIATLVLGVAFLGSGRFGNSGASADVVLERLDEMRTSLKAMEAESARIKVEYDTLKTVLSQLQQEQRDDLSAKLQSELTSPRLTDSFSLQVDAIARDPTLSSQEKSARTVGILTSSLVELDDAIDQQEQRIREKPSSVTSIDVETMKLKRLIDRRSQAFDMLRGLIDRYNQTAKDIIASMGR